MPNMLGMYRNVRHSMSIVLGMHRIIEYYIGVRHEHVAYARRRVVRSSVG